MRDNLDADTNRLSTTRRKRAVPEDWATPDSIENFDVSGSIATSHRNAKTLALDKSGASALVAGPQDLADVCDIAAQEVTQPLQCRGAATDALWWEDRQIIANSTGGIQIFEKGTQIAEMRAHAGSAVAIALHPCGDLLGSVGVDKSYVLYDLASFKVVSQVHTDSGK